MAASSTDERREIVIPHAVNITPVTAIKHGILLASLDRLHSMGLYERYAALVNPEVPERIRAGLAMNWAPLDLALAHYGACESMVLPNNDVREVSLHVADRVRGVSLASAAKKARASGDDIWPAFPAVHRMWPRNYQGGSAQLVKLGPTEILVELVGFVLHQFRYFRQGQLAVVGASYEAVGAHLTAAKIESFNAARDELVLRFAWA